MNLNLQTVFDKVSVLSKSQLVVAAGVGAGIGAVGSLVVNACLLEISLNGFFTVYFSLIFLIMGGFMLYRSIQKNNSQNDSQPAASAAPGHQGTSLDQTFMREEKNYVFTAAAACVLLSGVLIFLLEKNWTRNLPYLLKVPIYTMVAMSLNYLVLFSIIDFVNFTCSYLQSQHSLNVVEAPDQILVLLGNCMICGMIYGLVFSLLDVEDTARWKIRQRFFYEEGLCLPIGIVGGIIGGIANEVLRKNVNFMFNSGRTHLRCDWRQERPLR